LRTLLALRSLGPGFTLRALSTSVTLEALFALDALLARDTLRSLHVASGQQR
jgi:hypothetical protein